MNLLKVAFLLMAVSFAPVLSQNGVCNQVRYRRALASPASYTGYVSYTTYSSYKCGIFNWRRCRRASGTATRSVTQYRTVYKSESYTVQVCCEGYKGSPPNCEIVRCPVLTNPANGNVQYSSVVYNSEAQYSCNVGYNRVGSSRRTCRATGHWSGSPPTCQAVICPVPTAPANGRVSHTSVAYTRIASYTCNSNYRLVGSPSRSCGSNGQWNGVQPTCEALRCPSLSPPANGQVSVSSYSPRGVATFSCDTGYKMIGSSSRICQSDETWTSSTPSCHAIHCSILSNPANGEVSHSSTTYSSVAVYTCDDGYNMVGDNERICQEDQRWSGSEPTCEAILCSTPSSPTNGHISYTSVQYGGVAYYTCFRGYKIIGQTSRTCRLNGTWTGTQPSCQRLRCPTLRAPSNGAVSVSHYNPGGLATYSCDIGYRIEGLGAIRVCQDDENWSQIQPSCQQIFCPELSAPANGSVSVESLTVGSMASFSCPKTHDLVGSVNVACTESGQWNGSYPLCIEKCVPSVGFDPPVSIAMREGQTVEVCLSSCACSVESQITIEAKARNAIGLVEANTDLELPDLLSMSEDSVCFDLTAIDDDLVEGDEYMVIDLFPSKDQNYVICDDQSSLSIIIVDNDELTIGFETEGKVVTEDEGTIEICVVVYYPEPSIPINDVVLTVDNYLLEGAVSRDDYIWTDVSLSISDSQRRACFSLEIVDDLLFEHTEKFSIELERNSRQDFPVQMTLDPDQFTVTIMDNDGVSVEFLKQLLTIEEGGEASLVCIEARFPTSSSPIGFYLTLDTKLLNADESDFVLDDSMLERFSNEKESTVQQCVEVTAINEGRGSSFESREEYLTIEMSVIGDNVMIEQASILIEIINTDAPLPPCTKFSRMFNTKCSECNYEGSHKCTHWFSKAGNSLDVPREVCRGEKLYLEECIMSESTKNEDCDERVYRRMVCNVTSSERLTQNLGSGVSPSRETSSLPSKDKRQTQPSHCYPADNTLPLSLEQCNVNASEIPLLDCPYQANDIQSRDPNDVCTKRSVLLVVDSSYTIGHDTFKDIAKSLSLFVSQLCGDVQFGLLKFSDQSYLEFCFDCYDRDFPRNDLRHRIRDMNYVGQGTFSGYAAKCAHEMMLGPECGNHDGRCIDVVFVIDGDSPDLSYYSQIIDACRQVECLHRNPSISNMLKVYAINIGDSNTREVECITQYSKLKNGESTIFQFKEFQELIGGLNQMSYKIKEEKHRQRMSGKIPELTCYDWFEGRGFYKK